MRRYFTLDEIAKALTGGNEREARKVLYFSGAEIDTLASDPKEPVSRDTLVDLAAYKAFEGTLAGRQGCKLAELLRQ